MNLRQFLIGLTVMLPLLFLATQAWSAAEEKAALHLTLRTQVKEGDRFTVADKKVSWDPKKTAIIICDMWDDHWCKSAAQRVGELAGPINEMVKKARAQGVFIIHAPSSVTAFYKDTPQRKLATDAPFAKTPVPLSTVERWGTMWSWPDAKREGVCRSTTPTWAATVPRKCKIREAWTRQIATIEIADGRRHHRQRSGDLEPADQPAASTTSSFAAST